MIVFRIPDRIIDEVHSMISNFWWGQHSTERWTHWVQREELVCPKEDGEMGFRDLRGFNTTFLAKQLWRLYQRPHSLAARMIQAKSQEWHYHGYYFRIPPELYVAKFNERS
ncbi:Uncharacterized mitochondrial protein AtMg00310 [Linum grandiflorum]